MFDASQPDHAYLLGFLLGDGTLSRGRGRKGRLSIELARRDEELLHDLMAVLPGGSLTRRVRVTNFSAESHTSILTWCRQDVRDAVAAAGMPYGRKDSLIAPPPVQHSPRDVARGFFDADGSLGFTARGFPFLSLVTKSPRMAQWWVDLLKAHCGATRTCRPNSRDGVANVMVQGEPAVAFAGWLYGSGGLALRRKAVAAQQVLLWRRPEGMRAPAQPRSWTARRGRARPRSGHRC